ncbi:MAG: thiamine diphosphokinase [Oscillospiraceae bacterium]|nr:thiamine diphosphokinase [Oscillospiraceae bacterium]
MSGKAVIVSGGTVDNYSFYSEILKDKYIICADGGIYLLQKLNIKPDMFLGDFDSCNFDEIKKTGFLDGCKDIKKFLIEKDATDTHIAVDFAVEKGFDDITLIGALGGRLDHSLANIMLLRYLNEKGVKGTILNEKNKAFLTDKSIRLEPEENRKLSLIPLTDTVEGLTLKNLKYPLENFTLKMGDSIGISNEFTKNCAEIIFKKGLLLVIMSED